MSMIQATEARTQKTLSKLIRFDGEVLPLGELIKKYLSKGWTLKVGQKSSVKYNRRKFNRMGGSEQAEYQKKLDKMIPEYSVESPDGISFDIEKLAYDYFKKVGL